jgi:TRAP-type C4-dicarboxylate transport system substrate-binding protein
MKSSKILYAGAAAALSVSAVATSTPATAQEVTLKAATFLPARATFVKPFVTWVGEVNKKCAGKVKITTVGPAAIKSFEQWNALKNGVVDMHYGPPNYYKGAMFEADVAILAKTSPAEQRKNGAWKMLNDMHMEKMNAVYLTNFGNDIRFFLYTNKPAKDGRFDGFRIRSVAIYDAFFQSYGAQTVRIAPPEIYTALERRTVDGYGWPSWGITDFGWQKYTKYRHGPGFFNVIVNILVNQDKWKSLPEGHRKCLMDMAIWVEGEWPKWETEETKAQFEAQKKAGIEYVDMGPDFPKKAEATYWELQEKNNPEFVKKIRPLLLGN